MMFILFPSFSLTAGLVTCLLFVEVNSSVSCLILFFIRFPRVWIGENEDGWATEWERKWNERGGKRSGWPDGCSFHSFYSSRTSNGKRGLNFKWKLTSWFRNQRQNEKPLLNASPQFPCSLFKLTLQFNTSSSILLSSKLLSGPSHLLSLFPPLNPFVCTFPEIKHTSWE